MVSSSMLQLASLHVIENSGDRFKVSGSKIYFFMFFIFLDSLLCADNKKYFWRIFHVKGEGLGSIMFIRDGRYKVSSR